MSFTHNKIYRWIKSIDWIFSLKVRLTDSDYILGRKAAKAAKKSKGEIRLELDSIRKYWGVSPDLYYRYRLFDIPLSREQLLDYIPKIHFYTKYYKDTYSGEQLRLYGNKLSLYKEFKRLGVPTPEVLGVICHGKVCNADMTACISAVDNEFEPGEEVFLKPVDGKGGSGIFVAKKLDSGVWETADKKCTFDELIGFLPRSSDYVIQKRLVQRHDLSLVNPSCINTLRVIMQWRDGKPYIAVAVLRMGRNNSFVDNSAKGGISVRIDEMTGKMFPLAHSEHGLETLDRHPDTGYVFKDGEIADWDSIRHEIEKHSAKFTSLKEWAWDVAVTEEGVCMIELNLEYGIEHLQSCCGGMRKVLNVYP